MLLLAALALVLDEPCWSDDSWPCHFIAPAIAADEDLPDGGVPVVFSVSRQGYPYGVHANITDHDFAVAIEAAVQQWTFAPGHSREDVVIVLERRDGVWRAPWESDCPVPAPEPLQRVEPELVCVAGSCPPLHLYRIFPAEVSVLYDILPSGETRISRIAAPHPFLGMSVERAVSRWIYRADEACLGATASLVFDYASE